MAIGEAQLETWSHQGSVVQSRDTNATIKRILESGDAPYSSRSFASFLQGSYGNDTNVYAESDVDVVILLDSTFYYDIDELDPKATEVFTSSYGYEPYGQPEFKAEVGHFLSAAFPGMVTIGSKAIEVAASGSRRRADILAAVEYRQYRSYSARVTDDYVTGVCFFDARGERVVNFPRQHAANCTAKHQATGGRFKPCVRTLKNLRAAMVEEGLIEKDLAPSYFLEGLLYNVPSGHFAGSYVETMGAAINWILEANRNEFVCVNELFYLLRDAKECWLPDHCDQFLGALVQFWNES